MRYSTSRGSRPHSALQARHDDFARIDAALVPLMCPVVALARVPVSKRDLAGLRARAGAGEAGGPGETHEDSGARDKNKKRREPRAEWSASALFERVFWLGDFNYRVAGDYDAVKLDVAEGRLGHALEVTVRLKETPQLLRS